MPYITPVSSPPVGSCREILVPNDSRMIAAVLGQILELTEARNWEQTDGITVVETVAAWQTVYDAFAQQTPCQTGGGSVDYQLHSDITLASDTTVYTLSNLHLLTGRDLIIEVLGLSSNAALTDLYFRVNGLSTSIYNQQAAYFAASANFVDKTAAQFEIRRGLAGTNSTNLIAFTRFEIPQWKDTTRYPQIFSSGAPVTWSHTGRCYVASVTGVQSVDLFGASGDLKAGTQIAVYSRG